MFTKIFYNWLSNVRTYTIMTSCDKVRNSSVGNIISSALYRQSMIYQCLLPSYLIISHKQYQTGRLPSRALARIFKMPASNSNCKLFAHHDFSIRLLQILKPVIAVPTSIILVGTAIAVSTGRNCDRGFYCKFGRISDSTPILPDRSLYHDTYIYTQL